MHTLVFSDTHLTHKFDPKKYSFLRHIITQADRVIINGDFWDHWGTSFDNFIHSEWRKLFPLLIEKQAIYIYGNHDPEVVNGSVGLFCVKAATELTTQIGQEFFRFTHGHLLTASHRSTFGKYYNQLVRKLETLPTTKLLIYFLNSIGAYIFKLVGYRGLAHIGYISHSNRIMKARSNDSNQGWLCCGDSHLPELDALNRYLNSGCILQGHASYLLIHNDQPELRTVRY